MTTTFPELSYLGFVNTYSVKLWDVGTSYYTWGKEKLPEQPKSFVSSAETKVSQVGGPYFAFGQDFAERVLKDADYRVSALVNVLQGYKGEGEKLTEEFKQRREQYIAQLQEALDKAKSQNPELAAKLQKQIDGLKNAPDSLSERYNDMFAQLQETWGQFQKDPRVAKVIDTVKPRIEESQKFLEDSQSKVLADQRYANLFNFVAYHAKNIAATPVFQTAATNIKPYANKVVSEDTQNQYYDTVMKNIKPTVPPSENVKPASEAPKPAAK